MSLVGEVREALLAYREQAEALRVNIRDLDVEALLERSRSLADQRARVRSLGAALAEQATRFPDDARPHLAEIRALALAVAAIDETNRELLARARSCVDGYLNAVLRSAGSYDRRGRSYVRAAPVATISERA